jgi:pimeloyl-ACP methyl ester carboxylesterase
MNQPAALAYEAAPIVPGIRSRFVRDVNGLTMHILEAGFETAGRPFILLLHGFPELAYSWRKVMPALALAGYYVVAPDQRGYGRTTGSDGSYDGDLASFRQFNVTKDALALVSALGYREVACMVGHDFGMRPAAYSALIRPDVFRSVVLMSTPFIGPPPLPFDTGGAEQGVAGASKGGNVDDELATLNPPRKHYQLYYCTREADDNMRRCPQGIHAFLRAYYHYKSADWKGNQPFPLTSPSAEELAKIPTYYIMERNKGMAETVAAEMPSAAEIAACRWLPEEELRVYSSEFARNGFQGGLQWYRCQASREYTADLQLFSGRTIDVPSCFIAGKHDWGVYQAAGAFQRMQERVCTQMRGCYLIDGAGHWAQQEQAEKVSELLLAFLREK